MSTSNMEVAQLISYIVVLLLFASLLLPKKTHYTVSGGTMFLVGLLPILTNNGIIDFDINNFPVINFVIYFLVMLAGKDLFRAGWEEEGSNLRWPSIGLGLFLIIFMSIPTLHKMEIIGWKLPEYHYLIDSAIYISSGVFLIIGVFTLLGKDH